MVWHMTHDAARNTSCPRVAEPGGGGGAESRCYRSHAANWAGGSATTRNPIFACWWPQNSAHGPRYTPGASAWNQQLDAEPGMGSRIPARVAGQKEWMTSRQGGGLTNG